MPERIESYRDLVVWQQGIDLAVATYRLTRSWPKEEMYGLTSQVRRAANAVPANIAEGYGRESTGAYQQFLRVAQGSLKEFETHLIIAEKVGIETHQRVSPLLQSSDAIGRMLRQLIRKLSPE
ncbi:four helix bundle protein [Salmonella enterica subsp. enterica]|nr:four helix bundle protein [Salmonella enterica subsp. enterica]